MLHCGDDYQHWVTTSLVPRPLPPEERRGLGTRLGYDMLHGMLHDSLGQAKATVTPGLKKQVIELHGMTAGEGEVLRF